MWGKLIRYLTDNASTAETCTSSLLQQFLLTLESPASALRYARLIERVLVARSPNPAEHLSRQIARPKRPLPAAPGRAQIEALFQSPPDTWLELRDQALVATAIGSGAKPGELAQLRVTDLRVDEAPPHFLVTSHTGQARAVPLAPIAREPLRAWLAARSQLDPGDGTVFCTNKGTALSPSALWRAHARTCANAGIRLAHVGGQAMRNAFALRQLQHGKPAPVVRDWLGHKQLESTLRYKRLIVNPEGIEAD